MSRSCHYTTTTCPPPHFCITSECRCMSCDWVEDQNKVNIVPIVMGVMFGFFFLFSITMVIVRKVKQRNMRLAREKTPNIVKVHQPNQFGNIHTEAFPQAQFGQQMYNPDQSHMHFNMNTTLQADDINAGQPGVVFSMMNQPLPNYNYGINQPNANFGAYPQPMQMQMQPMNNFATYPNGPGFSNPNPGMY